MVASLAVDHKYQIDYSNFENTSFTKQVKNFGVQSTGAIFTKGMFATDMDVFNFEVSQQHF